MKNKQKYEYQRDQVDNLKKKLKEFGINTPQELDIALSKALSEMTTGIMTDILSDMKNTA